MIYSFRKLLKDLILLLICFTASFNCFKLSAQNNLHFIGKVIDSTSNQPIPFAVINTFSLKQNTTSNIKGFFSIDLKQKNNLKIEISCVSYASKTVSIDTNKLSDTITIKLQDRFLNIDEVVITATRTEKMLKDVPVLTQVIASAQMQNTGSTNISEIVNSVKPGVDFYNEGRGMTFRMQGLAAKYTLFLIDGERIAGENRDNIDYTRLTSSNIERVEIVQGASSSLYGSNAIGGVVNLITKTPVNPIEANIYSRASKYMEIENGANLGFKAKKLSYFADGSSKFSNGYDKTPSTPDLYTVEPYQCYSVFNKLNYDISEKFQISARASYFSRERFDVTTIPKHPFYTDLTMGLNAKVKYSENIDFTASVYRDLYSSYDVFERRNDSLSKIYSNAQLSTKLISNFKVNSPKFKIKEHISIGSEYLSDEVFAERIEDSIKSTTNYVIFAQDEILIKNNLNLTLGLRSDWHSDYGNSLSPKISFMFKHKKINYRATYAEGFRAPGIKERYYDFDLGFIMIKGNKELVPEKSYYKSISAEYLTSKGNISLNLYNNYLKDMILEQPIPGEYNGYTYKNISNAEISGIDLLARLKFLKKFSITSGYSFTYAIDKETNKMLSGVSKHSATLSIDYFKKWKSQVFGIACSGKIYGTKDFVNMTETGALYDDVFPTYTLWKTSIITKLLNDAIFLNLGIDNLYNYKTIGDIINTDPGRRFFISINISLDKLYKHLKSN
ncbi:MAG: TonB-dependent receptor [Bacteroidota bacterium]